MTAEEIAELRALIQMRADVNKRLRVLTGTQDTREAVRRARCQVDDADARRRPQRMDRDPGWGEPTVQRDFGWRSVWTTAVVGRQ